MRRSLKNIKRVFQRFSKDGVIDMDKRLGYKFSFTIHRLENVIQQLNGGNAAQSAIRILYNVL